MKPGSFPVQFTPYPVEKIKNSLPELVSDLLPGRTPFPTGHVSEAFFETERPEKRNRSRRYRGFQYKITASSHQGLRQSEKEGSLVRVVVVRRSIDTILFKKYS